MSNLKNINVYQDRYRDPQSGSDYYTGKQAQAKCGIFFLVKQRRNGVKCIEIVIGGYKYQVAKLDGDGTGKHQRTVPENEDPENVRQRPKQQVQYGLVFLQAIERLNK